MRSLRHSSPLAAVVMVITLLSSPSPTMAFLSQTATRNAPPAATYHYPTDRVISRSKQSTPPSTTTVRYHSHDHNRDHHDAATATRPEIEVIEEERAQLKSDFSTLLHTILNETMAEEELPSLFAQNIDMILKVIEMEVGGGLLEEIIHEEVTSKDDVSEEGGSRLD